MTSECDSCLGASATYLLICLHRTCGPCLEDMKEKNNNLCVCCMTKIELTPLLPDEPTPDQKNTHMLKEYMNYYYQLGEHLTYGINELDAVRKNKAQHIKPHYDMLLANIEYIAPSNMDQVKDQLKSRFKGHDTFIDYYETRIELIKRTQNMIINNIMQQKYVCIKDFVDKIFNQKAPKCDALAIKHELVPCNSIDDTIEIKSYQHVEMNNEGLCSFGGHTVMYKFPLRKTYLYYDIFKRKFMVCILDQFKYIDDDDDVTFKSNCTIRLYYNVIFTKYYIIIISRLSLKSVINKKTLELKELIFEIDRNYKKMDETLNKMFGI